MNLSPANTAQVEQTADQALNALDVLDVSTPSPAAAAPRTARPAAKAAPQDQPQSAATVQPVSASAASSVVPFTAADFSWMRPAEAHGAGKLSASAVAPLVASARGYFTIDPDAPKEGATKLGVRSMNSAAGRQIKNASETGDAMAMPWFAAASVAEAATSGRAVEMTTYQLRPSVPVINSKGKLAKYVLPAGSASVLDVHPATPAGWFTNAPTVVLAEGLLKADSALTAMLLDAGISREELASSRGGEPAAAHEALRALMEAVPVEKRVLIISLVGSGNWHQNADWNAISFRGRAAWVALDADVATNAAVWKQADQLINFLESPSKKAAEVHLVKVPAVDGDPKAGLDDFFGAGGQWAAVQGMLGSMPGRPELEMIGSAGRIAEVRIGDGITVAIVKKEVNGESSEVKQVIAEAAVVIEKVETVRGAVEGMKEESAISGQVSWVTRRAGRQELRQHRFVGIPLSALIGRSASVATFLAAATGGKAAGAVVDRRHEGDTLDAWRESLGRATPVERIRTSGLIYRDGRLGYVTSEGMHTSEGVDPTVRTDIPHLPAITMPFVQLDEEGMVASPARASEIVAAADQIIQAGEILNKSQGGLWEANIGFNVTISALDIQAKTTILFFGTRGFGKTTCGVTASGWNGPAWMDAAAIKLNGTPAQLKSMGEDGNNIVLFADDARNADPLAPQNKQFDALRQVIDRYIRRGNEPEISLSDGKVLGANGGYVTRVPLRGAVRSTLISGEDLDALGLDASTVQRGISWTVSPANPLYRGSGEADPVREALKESNAQALIKSVIIQENLAQAWGETEDERREGFHFWGRRYEEIGRKVLRQGFPEMTERDLGGLGPILGGIAAFATVAAKAAMVAGESREERQRFYDWREQAWRSVGEAWKRHRATYAEAQERTWQPVVERLVELFALRVDDGQPQPHLDGPVIGSVGATGIGDGGDIALFPGAIADLLSKHGYHGMTSRKLGSILKEIIKSRKHSVRIKGSRAPISAWLIDGSKWRLVASESATEGDAGLPATDPLPEQETADWDRELVLLTSEPAPVQRQRPEPAPVQRQRPEPKASEGEESVAEVVELTEYLVDFEDRDFDGAILADSMPYVDFPEAN